MKLIKNRAPKNKSMQNMEHLNQNKKFVFFCAGEDSGDILGAEAVSAMNLWGVEAIGVGGPRMQKEGLKQMACFADFASGFEVCINSLFQLHRSFVLLQ